MNPSPQLLPFVPLLLALCWAAADDFRDRRIRNVLTLPLLAAGVAQSFLGGTVSPVDSAAGAGVAFGLTLVLFLMRAVGGGDVKLLTAVGAWVGGWAVLYIFAAEAVVGMAIVLAQAAWQGRLKTLVRNTAVLSVALANADQVGMDHVVEMGTGSRSVSRPLPYAVPVLVATVIVLWVQYSP
jgi:prepilin peptidase CpaA